MKRKYIVRDTFNDAYLIWDAKLGRYSLKHLLEYYKIDRFDSYEEAEKAIIKACAHLSNTLTIVEIFEKE